MVARSRAEAKTKMRWKYAERETGFDWPKSSKRYNYCDALSLLRSAIWRMESFEMQLETFAEIFNIKIDGNQIVDGQKLWRKQINPSVLRVPYVDSKYFCFVFTE